MAVGDEAVVLEEMDINTNGISRAVQFVPGVSQPVLQGIPKSGRPWKAVQRTRSSSQLRKGPLKHMSKSFEERRVKKIQMQETKALGKIFVETYYLHFYLYHCTRLTSHYPAQSMS